MFSSPPFYFAVGRGAEALFSFGLVGALTPRMGRPATHVPGLMNH